MPPRRPVVSVSPADMARQRGIDPSFDLPVSPSAADDGGSSKHSDTAIQTLLFGDAMERTLARMRDHVRLSIDEAGVNPLFCVFGFLEWYEDATSETPLHAPLLLYPLDIERELVRGHYQYMVQSAGEVRSAGDDALVNVALRERLKRDFDIELPSFNEEEDTPEKYFTAIQKVIERHKAWKVRRWVTIGLFSFARIAMYEDLTPDRWKEQGGLHKHAGLSRILGGGSTV